MKLIYFAFFVLASSVFDPLHSVRADSLNSSSENSSNKKALPVEEIRDFVEVFQKIKDDYVRPMTNENLMESAMRGMVGQLDPHSSFLNAKHYAELQEGTSGQFGGLGVEISIEDEAIVVIAPIDDSPAKKAGILAGDIVTKVNNTPVSGFGIENAVRRMKGKPGTIVTITIQRKGHSEPINFKIKRSLIDRKSVKIKAIIPGYLYIRISHFQIQTGKELSIKVKQFLTSAKDPNGVVLDLRDNPGGVLNGAVAVSDAFLKEGLIVFTKGRHQESDLKYSAKKDVLIANVPLVVLINEGSASASEIVAGALQDNKRGIIAGRTSFGKGSVQTIYPMRNKTAIKLTTARYYTPSGTSIQTTGIIPDITIERLQLTGQIGFESVKEVNLEGHLSNSENNLTKSVKYNLSQLAKEDFELYQAINILKAITFVQDKKRPPDPS